MAQYQTSNNNIFYNTPTVSKSTSYGAVLADNIINVSAVPVTITMPAPVSSNNGKQWTIKDVSGSASTVNPITITATSATIDGSSNIYISQPYGSVTVYSNGATYFTVMPALMSINVQQFTASGTYTPSKGMQYCIVELVGGGGGGGGVTNSGTSNSSVGSAGGSGGYAKALLTAAQIGVSQVVTIGAGGAGGSNAVGNAGTSTSLGALMSGSFGAGGTRAVAAATVFALGGAGGTATVSTGSAIITCTGQTGAAASGLGGSGFCICGAGGSNPIGEGGGMQTFATTLGGGGFLNGISATGFGAGGSGGLNSANASPGVGGNGSPGVITIVEYI